MFMPNPKINLEADVGITSPFGSEAGFTEEYFEALHKKAVLDPEKALLLAVLQDAVLCFQKYLFASDRRGRNLFQEAEEWICNQDGDWVLSFDEICEALGLDPQYLRRGLLRWKEKRLRGHATDAGNLGREPRIEKTNGNGARALGVGG